MNEILLILIIILIGLNIGVIFYLVKNKQEKKEDPSQNFKDEFNTFKQSFSQSFGDMSTTIAKDMAGALTRVDEKVGVFNTQVKNLNESQENFSRILAGVKQSGSHPGVEEPCALSTVLDNGEFAERFVNWKYFQVFKIIIVFILLIISISNKCKIYIIFFR